MFKCVLDTNILISGVFWNGQPSRIIRLVQEDKILTATSKECFEEFVDKLKDKFHVPEELIQELIDGIFSKTVFIEPHIVVQLSEDKSDNKFLSVAASARVDYFITGNMRHFPIKVKDKMEKTHKVKIITATEFLIRSNL